MSADDVVSEPASSGEGDGRGEPAAKNSAQQIREPCEDEVPGMAV